MWRAQLTAWSERRSQGGASAVVIMGTPPCRGRAAVAGFSTADHTDIHVYVPVFWRFARVAAHPQCDGQAPGTTSAGQSGPADAD
jgi:hypothetical protein